VDFVEFSLCTDSRNAMGGGRGRGRRVVHESFSAERQQASRNISEELRNGRVVGHHSDHTGSGPNMIPHCVFVTVASTTVGRWYFL